MTTPPAARRGSRCAGLGGPLLPVAPRGRPSGERGSLGRARTRRCAAPVRGHRRGGGSRPGRPVGCRRSRGRVGLPALRTPAECLRFATVRGVGAASDRRPRRVSARRARRVVALLRATGEAARCRRGFPPPPYSPPYASGSAIPAPPPGSTSRQAVTPTPGATSCPARTLRRMPAPRCPSGARVAVTAPRGLPPATDAGPPFAESRCFRNTGEGRPAPGGCFDGRRTRRRAAPDRPQSRGRGSRPGLPTRPPATPTSGGLPVSPAHRRALPPTDTGPGAPPAESRCSPSPRGGSRPALSAGFRRRRTRRRAATLGDTAAVAEAVCVWLPAVGDPDTWRDSLRRGLTAENPRLATVRGAGAAVTASRRPARVSARCSRRVVVPLRDSGELPGRACPPMAILLTLRDSRLGGRTAGCLQLAALRAPVLR